MTAWLTNCQAQNSIETNEIIRSHSNLLGVQSQSGKLLIDTAYKHIRLMHDGRNELPPRREQMPEPTDYYIVSKALDQHAIFNKNGKLIFDFIDCESIYFDEHTELVVVTIKLEDNRRRSYLYKANGKLLFKESFEDIGFLTGSDLLALIADDGPNEEYYLYHFKTKKKLGPYSHFNIYNQHTTTPMGMKDEDFEPYKQQNVITVRTTVNNDYIWGMLDMDGKELFPIEYAYFRIVDDSHTRFFRTVKEKPTDVNFLFHSKKMDEKSSSLFLDAQRNVYRYTYSRTDGGKIERVE